jgi:hypothetical protein
MLYSVSDLIGPSSGRKKEKLCSSYNTVAARSIEQYVYYHLPTHSYSLKEAPEDGPMRSETL